MSVLNSLASSLGRKDQGPNDDLARKIVLSNNKKQVQELVDNLYSKNRNIQNDCIKVLYEIGELKPELIAEYDKVFLDLLSNKNNRMIWGAMHALDAIAFSAPKQIYRNLSKIIDAVDKGSVITKDHGVGILIKLAGEKSYTDTSLTLLLEILKSCATNQLPMYAENSIPVITKKYKKDFVMVLTSRLNDVDKDSKRKRVEKVIRKLSTL
jgi:hypothetical protein